MLARCRPTPWQRTATSTRKTLTIFKLFTSAVMVAVLLSMNIGKGSGVHVGTRYASRIVETKSGQIRGIIQDLNSQHLDPVEVFRGIPYASPPIGDLRFQVTAAPLGWKGVKRADTFGPVCPQNFPDITNRTLALEDMPLGRYTQLTRIAKFITNQSEDCLYLNLYIPGSGALGLEAPYAVIVYVHGESFEWGTGNIYDGSVLASAGHAIVITLNYRLGILGFLRTRPIANGSTSSNSLASGNWALHDIAMALTWVRENIASFGGDPNRITLMGHDTGAALVNYLLLAPFAKGLFHNIVLLSGSALSPWAAVHGSFNDQRIQVAKALDCKYENGEDISECLRNSTLAAILDIELNEIKFMPRIGPTLPIDYSNPDPALDMERISDGFIKAPLILGVTNEESYLDFNANDIQFGFEEDQRNRILRTFIRNAYVYHLNEIFSAVRNEYTDWDKPVLHPINIRESTMEALSDGHTVAPLMRIAYYHARRGAKTYFFHFNYQSRDSDYPQRLGSVRGEDIPYVFGLPLISGGRFFPQNYSRADQGVAEAVLTFFTNFAKTGNPNEPHNIESVDYGTVKEKTRYRGLTWEQYDTATQQYLMIALKPKMKNHYRGHKMAVWLNLIPQLHQPGDDVSMKHHHFKENDEIFYAGPVRDEWYTPLPLPTSTKSSSSLSSICTTSNEREDEISSSTIQNPTESNSIESKDDSAGHLLQRLASRHYYSSTTALAITVGVGCILLILNMMIFAGIYYQRDREKKRSVMSCSNNGQGTSSKRTKKSDDNKPTSSNDLPPSYTTLSKSPSSIEDQMLEVYSPEKPVEPTRIQNATTTCSATGTLMRAKEVQPPKPPLRTSSSLSSGTSTVKKRVQIQEMTV